jgi:release factor glutamine methyltransferase
VTLREAIAAAADKLDRLEDLREYAARDAELLLLHMMAAPRTLLFTDGGRAVGEREQEEYDLLIGRRLRGEPIQYITGEQEFYGLPLRVTPAVLIPRPETELLVEAALERLPKDKALRIVDVGTGSGAIAIAVAKHLPLVRVTAVDLSAAALEVALRNAERLGLAQRMHFIESDLLSAVLGEAPLDAVLSNPPYIPTADRGSLHRQVREHEPDMALFAGVDGLEIYRRLIPQAADALAPDGLLAMEIGYGQQAGLRGLLRGWNGVEFRNDLQGIARVVLATRN